MNPEDIEYESVGVKAVLAEMRDTTESLINPSYLAVPRANDDLAAEAPDLEERMDILQLQACMSLMMVAHSPENAEELAPVLDVAGAAEKTPDAAGDTTRVTIEDIGLSDAIRAALPEAVETTIRCELTDESSYAGRNLGDINMETETGVRVTVIHRAGEWVTNPDHETTLRVGDVPLLRGRNGGFRTVHEAVTGLRYDPSDVSEPTVEDLKRAVGSIALMRDMSEFAADLAYGAVLSNSEGVAEEVGELEAEMDALKFRFEVWTLRAASRIEDPVPLRELVQLTDTTEMISDTALEIAEGVLRGIDAHPVVAAAVKEPDGIIIRLRVAPASDFTEVTLGDRRAKSETGMRIIAVRRAGGREWVVLLGSETRFHDGDLIIARGTRAGAERLGEFAGDECELDE